jgi:hypothetical protein
MSATLYFSYNDKVDKCNPKTLMSWRNFNIWHSRLGGVELSSCHPQASNTSKQGRCFFQPWDRQSKSAINDRGKLWSETGECPEIFFGTIFQPWLIMAEIGLWGTGAAGICRAGNQKTKSQPGMLQLSSQDDWRSHSSHANSAHEDCPPQKLQAGMCQLNPAG